MNNIIINQIKLIRSMNNDISYMVRVQCVGSLNFALYVMTGPGVNSRGHKGNINF